ncbi:hypothetical protein PoB_005236800 [Plakobranchus ocellatus]|uniref:Uncharacterized protein n=1 Tax=Plakobranchus ocellatus TaxID=259542 RepID=A0AAV4C381_9GAST|nr:hypothetical protein PoB_005236800 [Plakobranchus ocellatus]
MLIKDDKKSSADWWFHEVLRKGEKWGGGEGGIFHLALGQSFITNKRQEKKEEKDIGLEILTVTEASFSQWINLKPFRKYFDKLVKFNFLLRKSTDCSR